MTNIISSRSRKPMSSKRQVTLDEFKRLHGGNLPFGVEDVANAVGISRSLVSSYSGEYVQSVADRLMDQHINDDLEFEQWCMEFFALRSFFNRTPRREDLYKKWVRLHIERIHRAGRLPTNAELRAICSSHRRLIRPKLIRWSEDTGIPTKPIKLARIPKRPAVLAEFERMHKLGVPFQQKDVANSVGVTGSLVSLYCKEYVRDVADRMLKERIDSDTDFERWRSEFLTLRAYLNNTLHRAELFSKWVQYHIEFIYRSGRLPIYSEVKRICGSGDRAIRAGLAKWSTESDIPIGQGVVWKDVLLEEVLDSVHPDLRHLPLTFLEHEGFGEPFSEAQRRMVFNIVNPRLKNIAFFVMAFADRNRVNDLSFFTQFDAMMSELGLVNFDQIVPDTFYSDYHDGLLLPKHSKGKRGRFVQTFFRLIRRQKDYLRKLTDEQRALVQPFLLKPVSDDHFWRQSTLLRADNERRVQERKADVAVVHSKFYQIREIVERRCNLIERLNTAFNQAVVAAKEGAKLPLQIILEEEIFHPGRTAENLTIKMLLWDGPSLKRAHIKSGDRGYYKSRESADHPSSQTGQFFLSYDRGHRDAEQSTGRYWFSELMAAGHSEDGASLKNLGVSRGSFNNLPRAKLVQQVGAWLKVLRAHTAIDFIPIDLCMTCSLISHAAIQIMTKTGARANEFLQIRLQREHLVRASLVSNNETIMFHAIPKGRTKEEPFYIDERCMKALFTWWKYRTGQGYVFGRIDATRGLRPKLHPAAYLWQLNGKHLDHRELNCTLDFMLFDIPLEKADGSKVQLSSHLLRHSFATEMRALDTPIDVLALLMNQRDTSVTEYYSKPTPPMLADFQRRIFENKLDLTRTHRRSAGQIARQVEEAISKVGALAPVVGGNCTVANACPAAFACLGCFGNAPNTSKRGQVVEYKARYTEMAEFAKVRDLPHERRKALDIVSNCDDMLAEMDCLEAAERAEQAPLSVKLKDDEGTEL